MKKQKIEVPVVALAVTSSIDTITKDAAPLVKALTGVQITTKAQYDKAAAQVAKLKEYRKYAEAKKDSIVNPIKLSIKNTEKLFKPFLTLVDKMETETKSEMVAYLERCEAEAKRIEAKFESGEVKRISTVTQKTSALRDTSSENASVREVWTLTIEDSKKVPREYCVPDEAAIKTALKAGKKVAGCTWKQKKSIAI